MRGGRTVFCVFADLPQSDNNIYFTDKRGKPTRRLKSSAKAWKDYFTLRMIQAGARRYSDQEAKGKVFGICGHIWVPKNRIWAMGDLSNRWKLLIDATASHLNIDDRYLVSLQLTKGIGGDGSEAVTVVTEVFDSFQIFTENEATA